MSDKTSQSQSQSQEKVRPTVVRKAPATPSDVGSEMSEDAMMAPTDMMAHVLGSVLEQFLVHEDEEGNLHNIANVLAEINENLHKNTQCIYKLYKEVERLNASHVEPTNVDVSSKLKVKK